MTLVCICGQPLGRHEAAFFEWVGCLLCERLYCSNCWARAPRRCHILHKPRLLPSGGTITAPLLSKTERLSNLEDLRERGSIVELEYRSERNEILSAHAWAASWGIDEAMRKVYFMDSDELMRFVVERHSEARSSFSVSMLLEGESIADFEGRDFGGMAPVSETCAERLHELREGHDLGGAGLGPRSGSPGAVA